MDKYGMLKKLENKTSKKYLKLVNNITETEFYNLFGPYSDAPYIFEASKYTTDDIINIKSFSILSNLQLAKIKRNNIVDTFKSINYKKQNKKWTTTEKIGFMEEMIRCKFNKQIPDCGLNEYKKQISERYDVPINNLNSTMAIFLTNIRKGLNSILLDYFSWNELFLYTYTETKNPTIKNYIVFKEDKLLKDFSDNKLTDQELDIYKELNNI